MSVESTLARKFGDTNYTEKDGNERDWVTEHDKWAQEIIADILAGFDHDVGIVGEENGVTTGKNIYWTIDPIDGSSHYVRGNRLCTTQLALVDHGVPVVAVINDFLHKETYGAVSGSGAFIESAKPEVSRHISVSERGLSAAYLEIYTNERKTPGSILMSGVREAGAYLLRQSASGHTMASVARGGIEGFISLKNPYAAVWDVVPGALLIHEAGGIVRSIDGSPLNLAEPNFIASNKVVFPGLQRIACEAIRLIEVA